MPQTSSNKPKRSLRIANNYQKKIILLTFLPNLLNFICFNTIVLLLNPNIFRSIFHTTLQQLAITPNEISFTIIAIMCLILIFSLYISFKISQNMVGGFDRIIRELDEIIARKSQKTILGRPKDSLTKELLERINILTKYYIEKK